MSTSSTKNLFFPSLNLYQSEQMISDPLISSTTQEINASKELKNNFGFSNERLKFFISKNNVYNILTQKLNADNSCQLISSMRKNLLISKLTMLNSKIDVIETIAYLYFKNLTETINLALLKTELDFECFSTSLTSMMKSNPVHVKADPETVFMLHKFSETLYHARSRSSFPFSIIKISRYVKNNQNKFSLTDLLNTFLLVIMESKHIQSDLKSISFTVLFLYGILEKKLIKNLDFIVKDMLLKVILLVNLYKIIEEDVDQCLLKKQKLYENIEQEIMKSFVITFYNRDLKRAISKIEAVKMMFYTLNSDSKLIFLLLLFFLRLLNQFIV